MSTVSTISMLGMALQSAALVLSPPAVGRSITVRESSSEATCKETGGKVWDSGRLLSTVLADAYCERLPQMSVLELGSGTGIGGLTAAAAGASVTLTDGSLAVLPLLEANVRVNELESQTRVCRLQWGDDSDVKAVREADRDTDLDLIIGSDLLYTPEVFPDLLDTLEGLCTPGVTEVLFCFPPRHTESIFFEMAESYGFEVGDIDEPEPGLFAATMVLASEN